MVTLAFSYYKHAQYKNDSMADRMWRRRAEGHVHELTSLFCGMENQQILSNNDTPRNRSVSDGKESACSAGDLGSIPGW